MGNQPDYSLEVAHEIDEEVRKLIEAAHTEAWEILNTYRDVLDALVFELLEKETLTRKDLERIFDRGREAAADHRVQRLRRPHAVGQAADQDARPSWPASAASRGRRTPSRPAQPTPVGSYPGGGNGVPVPGPNGGPPAGPARRLPRRSRHRAAPGRLRPPHAGPPHAGGPAGAHRADEPPVPGSPAGPAEQRPRPAAAERRCRRTTAPRPDWRPGHHAVRPVAGRRRAGTPHRPRPRRSRLAGQRPRPPDAGARTRRPGHRPPADDGSARAEHRPARSSDGDGTGTPLASTAVAWPTGAACRSFDQARGRGRDPRAAHRGRARTPTGTGLRGHPGPGGPGVRGDLRRPVRRPRRRCSTRPSTRTTRS